MSTARARARPRCAGLSATSARLRHCTRSAAASSLRMYASCRSSCSSLRAMMRRPKLAIVAAERALPVGNLARRELGARDHLEEQVAEGQDLAGDAEAAAARRHVIDITDDAQMEGVSVAVAAQRSGRMLSLIHI